MDIKSILRTFRYTEMQAKADRDPNVKRPPTIKFLTVTLLVAVVGFGFAMLVMSYDATPSGDGSVLSVSDSTDSTNSTTPAPTASQDMIASAQEAPGFDGAVRDD